MVDLYSRETSLLNAESETKDYAPYEEPGNGAALHFVGKVAQQCKNSERQLFVLLLLIGRAWVASEVKPIASDDPFYDGPCQAVLNTYSPHLIDARVGAGRGGRTRAVLEGLLIAIATTTIDGSLSERRRADSAAIRLATCVHNMMCRNHTARDSVVAGKLKKPEKCMGLPTADAGIK